MFSTEFFESFKDRNLFFQGLSWTPFCLLQLQNTEILAVG